MKKKDISAKTATKALINGFVAYGVLVVFLFIILIILISYSINNHMDTINFDVLKYSLPGFGAFVVFFLIHAICRLSTFDLFKDCKIEKDKVETVSNRMNLFFIFLIGVSVVTIIFFLSIKFNNEKLNIEELKSMYYSQYNEDFAQYLTLDLLQKYQINKTNTLIQTIILECGLLLGIFSLIPAQKRLIEKYNT